MTRKVIIICAGICAAATLAAQEQAKDSTLNRTVVVENQYNPEVMDAFKVNILPKVEEPAVAKQEINYAAGIHPFAAWEVNPMKPFNPEMRQENAHRGYARISYGNRNNTDVKGSYLWDITKRDRLGVMASLYGMYGDIPNLTGTQDWKSRFYRTDAALDYTHDFRKVSLKIGGDFASQVFNYMPASTDLNPDAPTTTGRQHYTLGEGYVRVASQEGQLPVEFALQSGFRSFNRKYDIYGLASGAEKIIHTSGFIAGNINEEQQVGVGLVMDNLMYDAALKNYTLVQLNPYYTIKNDDVSLRLGAHVDVQAGHDGGVNFAPDVKLAYTFADSYVIYVQALGGSRLNDFRTLNDMSPYWAQLSQLRTSSTPLDAGIGLKASPVSGLGFHLYGGYRITKNELFSLPGIESFALADATHYTYNFLLQDKAKVGYGGASISYAYKDWIDFTLQGTYYGWNTDSDNELLLALKPEFAVGFYARSRIMKDLHIALDYRYEGRKDIAGQSITDPINSLSVSAEYELLNRITVFARLNNLLNKNYITETGYPVQGFNVMAGISVRF